MLNYADLLKPSKDEIVIDFSKKRFDKFIFPLRTGCSGIGNQMFRIAALYGIGLHPNINRSPGLSPEKRCMKNYIKEFSDTFPNVMKLVEFVVSSIVIYFSNFLFSGFDQ